MGRFENGAVVRLHNVSATGFEARLQQPLNSSAVTASTVYCLVAEEGLHSLPGGGSFEAHTVVSTDTSGSGAGDDEDGVTFRSPAGSGHSLFADVVINNPTGADITICAWLDVPAGGAVDGVFDAADGSCQTAVAGSSTQTFQWSGLPEDMSYTTYARFRLSSTPLTTTDAAGIAADGEVEDYRVVFDFTPTVVTIGKVELSAVAVGEFLAGLNIRQMDRSGLLTILTAWDPAQAELLAGADPPALEQALGSYLDPDGDSRVAVLSCRCRDCLLSPAVKLLNAIVAPRLDTCFYRRAVSLETTMNAKLFIIAYRFKPVCSPWEYPVR